MKKHSSLRRILAVCLSLAMVLSLLPGAAMAAGAETGSVSFEEIDPSEVSADIRGGLGSGLKAEKLNPDVDGTPFDSKDRVRVMIVMPGEPAIALVDEGLDASDPRVEARREEILLTQQDAAEVISEEALDGEELDVVWNLTLAVNAISANVEYGQIERIADIPGVKAVYLERRYDPMGGGKADLNNIPAQGTTGAAALKLDGYTGAGMRIAVIDTGTARYHQSFDGGAFEYSLEQQAAKKNMDPDDYIASLNLLDVDELTEKIQDLNIYQQMEGTYADRGGYWDDWTIPSLYKSSKLPFGFNYIDGNTNIDHFTGYDEYGDEAYEEHGSHVAGIAAANTYIPSPDGEGYVDAASTVGVTGVAPDAQIITMKVFGANGGAYTSDNFAAIEDAMVLDCDVVNLSLGSSGGFVTAKGEYRIAEGDTDSVTEEDRIDTWVNSVMDRITKDGIIMCVSAGNSGNWAEGDDYSVFAQYGIPEAAELTSGMGMMYTDEGGTYNVGSPSTFHNTMSVASADNVGGVSQSRTTFTGTKSIDLSVYSTTSNDNPDWSTMDENDGGGTAYEVVFLGDPSTGFAAGQLQNNTDTTIFGGYDEDGEPIGSDALSGKIVMISRGTSSFFEKRDAAADWGAAAVICYNHTPDDGVVSADLTGSESGIPFGGLSYEDGKAIFELCTKNSDGLYACTATIYGSLFVNLGEPDAKPNMSSFSSWGTTGALTIKPEITTPGGSIYSVNGGEGGWGDKDQYENMSGTSMAAPHFSGLAALTKQYIRSTGLLEKARAVTRSTLTDEQLERQLAQSLLMSTAEPLVEYTDKDGNAVLYSIRDQGAGLANVQKATSAKSFIMVDGQPDGKVKAELGEGTGWSFGFTVYNLTGTELVYDLSAEMMTTGTTAVGGNTFSTNAMVPLDAGVSFSTGNRVTVPANGSVKVNASVTVSSADVRKMAELGYDNGFYVEGFVYAKPVDTTREGVLGVTHSIPMLGWYGSWTDISMFDGDSFLDTYYPYLNGEELRLPHVFNWYAVPVIRNILMISQNGADPDDPEEADWYSGNLYEDTQYGMYGDSRYIPARNALNNTGEAWWQPTWFSPMLMRNAIAARVRVVDNASTQVYYEKVYNEPFEGAYAHSQLGVLWDMSEYNYTPIEYDFSNIPEGRDITISFTYAPEYYENANGTVRWNDLHEGATMSFPFRVDNTSPELLSAACDGGTLTVKAKDNNYLAFVSLLNGAGNMFADLPVCPDMDEDQRGGAIELKFDIAGQGNKVIVALCDYAGNEVFYKVNISDGGYPGGGYGDLVAFQSVESYEYYGYEWVSFDAHVNKNESELFSSDVEFMCADYAGGNVYAQDEQRWLYGIVYDDMVEGVMDFDAARITRLDRDYWDMAYNYADGLLYAVYPADDALATYIDVIDLNNGGAVEELACVDGVQAICIACDDNGTLYLIGVDNDDNVAQVYVGTRDSAAARASYDLNGDRVINIQDARDLMEHVICGASLKYADLGDLDRDGRLTTEDVHLYLDFLEEYKADGNYDFAWLMDTGLDMDYGQSAAWDHNTETLYWARCHYLGIVAGVASELYEINPAEQTCEQTGVFSYETFAMFAPLTDVSAAKAAHKNVPEVTGNAAGWPVLTDTARSLAVGGRLQLEYIISPWYAEDVDVKWESDDPDVASVNRNGVVTANDVGTCTITVSNANNPSLSSSCEITVVGLELSISGTYSVMGDNIGSFSESKMYHYAIRNGRAAWNDEGPITSYIEAWGEPLSITVSSAALRNGELWMSNGAYGLGGSFLKVDPRTYEVEEAFQPVASGDTLHSITYSRATDLFNGTYNYALYVDLPLEKFMPIDTYYDFEDPDFDPSVIPDLWMEMLESDGYWHCIDLMMELTASDEGFDTNEYGNGAMTNVVLCGITDIGSDGTTITLNGDLFGDYGGASGKYTPATTMVLLDNVGRLWYVDELTDMEQKLDDDWMPYYEGECGWVSGEIGVHTPSWVEEGETTNVFVVRDIVETQLTDMFRQDKMPRYTYHYSDIYYAGLDNNGSEVYLLSLYDYHNAGITNEFYLLIMDENGTVISIGDAGDYNIIATIYEAHVNMDTLPAADG